MNPSKKVTNRVYVGHHFDKKEGVTKVVFKDYDNIEYIETWSCTGFNNYVKPLYCPTAPDMGRTQNYYIGIQS